MKKFLFIAAAALTLAACAKNELIESASNSKAISFQVASYANQTKANVAFAGDSFKTNAWFHDEGAGAAQPFMNQETVTLQGTSGNAYWAPSRTYFWPKTGYINFFSYAGTPVPTDVATEAHVKYGESTTPSYVTIGITDDPLVAEGAFGYKSANYANNLYAFQYNSTDVTGVPTLFHHLAAKVSFIVTFDGSSASNKNKWELTINKADFIYADEGYIDVAFAAPGTTPGQSWPYPSTGSNSDVRWTAETGDNRTLAAPATGYTAAEISADASRAAVTIGGVAAQTIAGGDVAAQGGAAAPAGKMIFKNISVLPQTFATTTPKFALCYTLMHYYNTGTDASPNWVAQTTETVNLTDAAVSVGGQNFPTTGSGALLISAFRTDVTEASTAFANWQISHKYVYTVTITPNHEIHFSPAVVDWETDITAGYVYPEWPTT